jgi:hypothetical protein
MRKVVVTLVLLLSATWLLAQDSMSKSADASTTTIQGCLSKNGSYFYLTDTGGMKYHLVGYNVKEIGQHVGHTVEITGMSTVKTTGTTAQGAASTAKEAPVFRVKSMKHIADTCKAM